MGGEAGTYLDDIEDRDVHLVVDHRTKPRYQTDGPGDGRTWLQHHRDIKASAKNVTSDESTENHTPDEDEIEILIPGYDLSDEERAALSARSAPAQLAKRLTLAGWSVRVTRSLARVPAVLYRSDSVESDAVEHRAGDVRFPEHELETLVVIGEKRYPDGRPGFVVEACWTSKDGFKGAHTYDPALGLEWRPKATISRDRNEIEVEDGVAPPLGLKQWLDMTAPRGGKK